MNPYKEQAELLKYVRCDKLNMSQAAFAKILGYDEKVGAVFISNIERGLSALPVERWRILRKLVPQKVVLEAYLKDQTERFNYEYGD